MDTESQRIYDRMSLHQLMQAQPHWTAAQLAAAVGHSERWARKWVKRFHSAETADFGMYLSQSRAPKSRPRQTDETVKDVICELRETLGERYHRPAGAKLIRLALLQEARLDPVDHFIPTSSRTITRILRERGYIQDPPQVENNPLTPCEPMEEWEMDFCGIRLQDGRFEFFLVVDRGTSRVVHLEGCEGYRVETALRAVYQLLARHGLPKRLRFDRDSRLVWSWSGDGFPAPLVRFLQAVGVEPIICPPRRPDKKPYVERCIRTLKHEWLDRFSLNTLADCYEALEAFPHYHNTQRLHLGRACQGRTPDEAFPKLPALPRLPEVVNPNGWLKTQQDRVFRRTIRANGTFQIDKHLYYVDYTLAKQAVLVQMDAQQRGWRVMLDGKPLPKVLPLKDLPPDQLDLHDYLQVLQQEAISIAFHRHRLWMRSGDTP